MAWLDYTSASLFTLLGIGCLMLVVIGMPGTWLMIGLAALLEFAHYFWADAGDPWMIPLWVFIVVILVAGLGELLELVAGAFGAKKGGASKKGMIGALIGGILGALVGTFAIPIPLVGSLVGAVLGCATGAILGELNHNPNSKLADTIKPAAGAVAGRILGTLAKLPCAIVVWAMLSSAAFWR